MSDVVDLSEFIPADAVTIDILKPGTDKPTGWRIDLAGPAHEKTVAWATAQARKANERAARIEAQQMNGRKIKPEERDVDQQRLDNIGWAVSRIIGWTPVRIDFISAEPIPYSEKAAFDVMSHPRMGWALRQIIEYLGEEHSFTKGSARP